MSIVETITNDYHFWDWLKQSDSYKDNFSLEGAKAVQQYFEELSDSTGENIEFDPIAWCVEFSEYDSFEEFNKDYSGDAELTPFKDWDELSEHTTVIELSNGGAVVGEF
jgi:hypothetical protein